ncbi:hypothetical protein Tco_1246935, partial [Tanacetum coccineum]
MLADLTHRHTNNLIPTGALVSTAEVSAAATITTEEITLAQALASLKSAKPKVNKVVSQKLQQGTTKPIATPTTATTKGILLQEPSETRKTTRTTTKIATTPITSSKDKGKGIMVEEPLKMKPKDQDKVETDYELAQRLQAEEQEELIIEEKSKLFQQLLEKRRKHFADKRAEERINKPPTKAQQRSIMTTYLKKHDMDTELVEGKRRFQQCFELVTEEDVGIDAIPLATKHAPIVNFQIHRKGRNGYYEIMLMEVPIHTYCLVNCSKSLTEKTSKISGCWLRLSMGIQGQKKAMKECYG